MSKPENLRDLYIDELRDLWSANDQMERVIAKLAPQASDAGLRTMLDKSLGGIAKHTATLKALLAGHGEETSKEHCRGMQGLVAEATKHAIDDAPPKGPVLDAVIIAQYQRMTHYGIAGFGTAASFAGTLDLDDDQAQLREATGEMYGGDQYLTKLAEAKVNVDATVE